MENEPSEKTPMFMSILSPEDKTAYEELQNVLAAPDHRYNRNKRIVTFQDMLAQIKAFCIKGDVNDWKRYLVCGICWIGSDIAINTRQLRILLGKSKSTINGAFSKMGYETLPFKNNDSALQEKIPFLKGNFSESRQWTVRRNIQLSSQETEKADAVQSPEPKTPAPVAEEISFPDQEYSPIVDDMTTEFNYDLIEPIVPFNANDYYLD
ncbi:hypothetical protein TVAG_237260 [Trichomonas vaginalis G3]|uniref:Initiator binding domain-containing protein n=1 Tax=Trichomonas vaginalis (strain ATCC PRA-98 / G3) TaxID=412133 RepID=A2DCS6_TRIV3|nr:transcription-initiator DNA-binding domain ibd family [Trichomonas vaginalis G3]EAY21700.1 hypothetical protein TVAG_237260 [Trichomonas vaginalis G3]KAI5524320.1 transcription-initiator DNA-binding domain ibd family [Trichomonas vaginalis G3]|eukprot:XP_001582686.1 hypothetical protein [Trichomonas vaginalis G3]